MAEKASRKRVVVKFFILNKAGRSEYLFGSGLILFEIVGGGLKCQCPLSMVQFILKSGIAITQIIKITLIIVYIAPKVSKAART